MDASQSPPPSRGEALGICFAQPPTIGHEMLTATAIAIARLCLCMMLRSGMSLSNVSSEGPRTQPSGNTLYAGY